MDEALVIWSATLSTGFCQESEWVTWADRQILELNDPPLWVLDLALVHEPAAALATLQRAFANTATPVWERLNHSDLCLGFLYLRFCQGKLSLLQLLLEAGAVADSSEASVDCEEFYYLANEIDGGGPTMPSLRPLRERVDELFKPMAELANSQWSRLIGQWADG